MPADLPGFPRPHPAMSGADWGRLLLLSVLWGGSFFFVDVALQGLAPLSVVWGRVALGALMILGLLHLGRCGMPRGGVLWRALAVMGLLNNAVPFTLFALAQGEISGALAAILNATTPLFGVVVAHLAGAERLTLARGLGVFCGFLGVVVIAGGGGAGSLTAVAACLGAAASYAVAGIWGRRFAAMGLQPLQTAFGQVAAAAVMLTPLWLAIDRPWTMPMPGGEVLAAMAGIAALSTALAYLLYFRLLASAGAVNLLLVTFLIPVSAAGLSALFLNLDLLPRHWAGLALVGLGLAAMDGRAARALRRRIRPSSAGSCR
jgi:drug/metabolite transporter (DMT)-like permease